MKRKTFLTFSLWFSFFMVKLFAAGPMTHLYFAERFCEMQRIKDEKIIQAFIVGSLFPDIRYTAHFPRTVTHFPVQTLNGILKDNTPFMAGMKFHAWIDTVREEYVEASGIYSIVETYTNQSKATLLKFIEEEILSDFYDAKRWSYCFDSIHEEERLFPVSEAHILQWNGLVYYSIQYKPSWLLWGASYSFKSVFGVPSTLLNEWSYQLPGLAKEKRFQAYVNSMLEAVITRMGQELL